jgi:phosphoribosyl 1,2-cyclic phosphodiesterase
MEQRLSRQMLGPNFPVPMQVMRSELKFYELTSGMTILLDDVTVETVFLNYSHRAMGYRVTWQGRSVVYAMDRVCYEDHIDQALLHLARQADLLILKAPNSFSEGGIHSSPLLWKDNLWQTGIETAKAAGVKRIVMSRYNPDYDDDFLDQVEEQVRSVFPNDFLAREGMIVPIA